MFTEARIKLTILFSLVILVITGTLSMLIYVRTSDVLDREFKEIEHRMLMESAPFVTRAQLMKFAILPEDFERAKRNIARQLMLINGVIVTLCAFAGYFLSGRTLQPIQKAMDEQKRFVGDAAHELKTPLTALKTSLEVNLMDESLSSQAQTILRENLEDVNSLQSLTENLLQLARHDTQLPVFEHIVLSQVVEHAVHKIKPLADKKSITVLIPSFPSSLTLEADKEAFERVILILLDNAIKYSSESTTISLEVIDAHQNILINVLDQGIGISMQHIPYIFDRFYRVDSSRTKTQSSGHGLGLSVARQIIEQHDGTLSVESTINKGTTFTISLPKNQPHQLPLLDK